MSRNDKLVIFIIGISLVVITIYVSKKANVENIEKFKEPLMVKIPKGSFMMGTTTNHNSKPLHKVTFDYDFEIGVYEITREEYALFSQEYKHHVATIYSRKKRCYGKKCPIVGVTWYNAKAYTQWLSEKTGKKYRLPSESEWEYVARAGTATRYYFGESEDQFDKHVWHQDNSSYKVHQVGLLASNLWGVYDIYGNVWEWCEDWYAKDYIDTPIDGSAYIKEGRGYKAVRGGSALNDIFIMNSDARNGINSPANHGSNLGFRVVRELVETI